MIKRIKVAGKKDKKVWPTSLKNDKKIKADMPHLKR